MKFFCILLGLSLLIYFQSKADDNSSNKQIQVLPCKMFPVNNIWNTPIDKLPIDTHSDLWVTTIGKAVSLHPDFGSGTWNGGPIGIPYIVVNGNQPKVNITFEYSDESDPGPYPIPPNAPIEGGSASSGDRHILVLDKDNCILYETWSTYPNGDGTWHAGSGAIFDMNSNNLRPDGWTSSDAAGLPILPGLVRYDEVAEGEINHAIRLTVPNSRRAYVWPARHYASSKTSIEYPPLGQRFRLKSSVDISKFSQHGQVILKAMKKYGMILADNGSAWFISGAPDANWNDDSLNQLKQIKGNDFEAVDCSSLMINANSGEAKQENTTVNDINIIETNISAIFNAQTSELIVKLFFAENSNATIELVDLQGNKISVLENETFLRAENQITLSNSYIKRLENGVYFLILRNGKILKTCKFIKY